MPYDTQAADGIRVLLSDRHDVVERKMMGGLVFMVNGNMCVTASGRGGILVRVGAEAQARVLKEPHVQPMRMAGRSMAGFVRVMPEGYRTAASSAQMGQARARLCRDLAGEAGRRARPTRTSD